MKLEDLIASEYAPKAAAQSQERTKKADQRIQQRQQQIKAQQQAPADAGSIEQLAARWGAKVKRT